MTRQTALAAAVALFVASAALAAEPAPRVAPTAPVAPAVDQQKRAQPVIQIALLLDTSNSMDGLIGQAKSQLWKLVNEFARAKHQGVTPRIEVALYEYGNDRLSATSGYLRRVSGLTTDLDRISEQLFALSTSGGDEYCGQVIDTATRELDWSTGPGTLKMVFIAGNEPFTQGGVDYKGAVKRAISKGIVVNTIFCGSQSEGVSTGWKDGALLADGRYSFIDSNQQVAHVAAPQDAELARLGQQLNQTYVAFGTKGAEAKKRQEVQDRNASSVGQGAGVNRAVAKASAAYRADDWDLVDATGGGAAMAAVPAAALPAEMQAMSEAERGAYVAEKAKEREELKTKIRKLEAERRAHVAAAEAKSAAAGEASFDEAVLGAAREQAARSGFEIK